MLFLIRFYSYLKALKVLIFEIFLAGKYEAIAEITKEITSSVDKINIIFVTLDPNRDNKEHLKDYVKYFDSNIIGITGDKIEIKKFAENWGVFYETVNTSNNNYTINHTATVFMIDELGNFRGTISWGENETSVMQKINNLSKLN